MGAVTSTVLFLLNSVTLGQVKAGTSSFIPLVLTYLSARCSVCVLDLDSQVRSVGRDISEGLGRKQPDLHLGTLVSKLFFPFRTPECQIKCSDQLSPHTQTPSDFQTLYLSLPNLFCFLDGSRKFLLCKILTVYSFIPYSDAYLLLSSGHSPLLTFLAGMEGAAQWESPFSHPLQSDLLLWRFLAPGASLAFGESTLAMSSPEPEDKSFLLGLCISSVMVMLPGFIPELPASPGPWQREGQEG